MFKEKPTPPSQQKQEFIKLIVCERILRILVKKFLDGDISPEEFKEKSDKLSNKLSLLR